ncbi:hypothetical protein BO78DRAFT_399333, partial [Aspergillus sclerotiicarbonarius CBS 121057]
MHTGKILMHPLKIEYMHMNTCLGYVKELAYETISLHPEMSVPFKFALIRSLNKILTIQNDLISRCYIREGQEFTNDTPNTEAAPPTDSGANTDSASMSDTRSSVDTRSIPDTTKSYVDTPSSDPPTIPDTRSIPETRSNADTGSIADNGSIADTSSIPDTVANSDTSSVMQDRQLHPRCLVPGLSQSRPTSSKGSAPSLRDRSASFDMARVRTATESTGSDPTSTAGSHRVNPSYAGTLNGFTSPFVPEPGQAFETKIWSAKSKQKWYKPS